MNSRLRAIAASNVLRSWMRSRTRQHRSQLLRSVSTSTSQSIQSRVIFSGIQPTGTPHLGNYLGALQNWVRLQKESDPQDTLIFSIVGWHALTLPQDPAALREARIDMFATLLSIGLDPERCVIFHQDQNADHAELSWLLNCITPMGKLRRMTTWKSRLAASRNANDESEVGESLLNAGLFTYPVLQAADILAYRATHVPVGEDQQQHLELCRDLAETFNRFFAPDLFPLPTYMGTPSKRVLSLRDPTSKMSKSNPDVRSRILLTDSYSQIRSKLRGAVTDSITGISYDPVNRPGISNLLTILAACREQGVESVALECRDLGHGQLKDVVAEAVEETLKGPREEFGRIRGDKGYLDGLAKRGAEKARFLSGATLRLARCSVGLDS